MSTSELSDERTERPDDIQAVPVRHPWRWVTAVIVVLIAASLIRSAVNDANFQWSVYFTKVGTPQLKSLNVETPAFFQAMSQLIEKEDLAAWKTPPREIALARLRRAEELGMTYREYAAVLLDTGVHL